MNNQTLISMLQSTKGVKTVKVKFSEAGQPFTYKTTEVLNKDDYVVVEYKSGYSIAKVVGMDRIPDVLREDIELKWVVQRVNTSRIEEIREEEQTLIQQLTLQEATRRLNEALGGLNLEMPALGGLTDAE